MLASSRLTSLFNWPTVRRSRTMAHELEPHVLEAFRADTRRIMARRVLGGVAFFAALVTIAGLIEVSYSPDRWRPLVASLGLEVLLCAVGLALIFGVGLQRHIVPIVCAVTSSIAFCVTGY